jgi:hypothetical protein
MSCAFDDCARPQENARTVTTRCEVRSGGRRARARQQRRIPARATSAHANHRQLLLERGDLIALSTQLLLRRAEPSRQLALLAARGVALAESRLELGAQLGELGLGLLIREVGLERLAGGFGE